MYYLKHVFLDNVHQSDVNVDLAMVCVLEDVLTNTMDHALDDDIDNNMVDPAHVVLIFGGWYNNGDEHHRHDHAVVECVVSTCGLDGVEDNQELHENIQNVSKSSKSKNTSTRYTCTYIHKACMK